MSQHQAYPHSQRQTSSPAAVNRNLALQAPQTNLLAPFNTKLPGNPANRNAPRQPIAAHQFALRQLYQLNPSYSGYQTGNKKKIYQITDENIDQYPEGFYTTFETEEEELAYLDEDYNEVFVNFVGIEAVCSKCRLLFPSKSKLYIYIKSGCVRDALPSRSPHLSSSIPVIVSKAVHMFFRLGFSFKGWTYTTIAVTFALEYLL